MGKTGSTKKMDSTASNEELQRKLVLTGADIMTIGEVAETIVGGKNYMRFPASARRSSAPFRPYASTSC